MSVAFGPDHECSGLTAQWCPIHGTCTCPDADKAMDDLSCPLHAPESDHPRYTEPDHEYTCDNFKKYGACLCSTGATGGKCRVHELSGCCALHTEPDHECSICGCHLPAERVRSREERQRANDAERLLEEGLSMDADKHEKCLDPLCDERHCDWCDQGWPCWTVRVRDFLEG